MLMVGFLRVLTGGFLSGYWQVGFLRVLTGGFPPGTQVGFLRVHRWVSSRYTGGFPPGTQVSFHTNVNISDNENDLHKLYSLFHL